MNYFVYILKSKNRNKTYVGYTSDLEVRLKEHNSGESKYTGRFKPWNLIYTEEFNNKNEAVSRERYYKTAAGRKWIKRGLFDK